MMEDNLEKARKDYEEDGYRHKCYSCGMPLMEEEVTYYWVSEGGESIRAPFCINCKPEGGI